MAAFMRCGQCGKSVEIGTGFVSLPGGWLSLKQRNASGPDVEEQFCSAACVARYVVGLEAAEREKAEEDERAQVGELLERASRVADAGNLELELDQAGRYDGTLDQAERRR